MKNLTSILTISGLLIVLVIYAVQGDARYAKSYDLAMTNQRLELKIIADKRFYLQKQIWALEDKPQTQATKEQIRELTEQIRLLDLERQQAEGKS